MTEFALSQWIQILFLGGFAGALGQGARAVVGIKKVNDQAAAENVNPQDLIVASRLFISLTIGFIAGALAAVLMNIDVAKISISTILGIAASGYAGTDFIEGIISKVTPTSSAGGAAAGSNVKVEVRAPGSTAPTQRPSDDFLG